jgi:hypothetical protein
MEDGYRSEISNDLGFFPAIRHVFSLQAIALLRRTTMERILELRTTVQPFTPSFSKWRYPLSHIVQIQTEIRDPAAVQSACIRLGLAAPQQRTVKLFSEEATGLAVQLHDWRYPVICDIESGHVKFDNYGGSWGDQCELNRFLQAYATEKAKIEARKRGHSVSEQALADGSIKLTIQVARGAA